MVSIETEFVFEFIDEIQGFDRNFRSFFLGVGIQEHFELTRHRSSADLNQVRVINRSWFSG
jgi:hypothetical protein